ncbi:PAS-domain containing protein [Roseibium sp.]|uniref:PAS-domain containing protein n=1 Tax=Roseibium sp. TaxID=1936156 RepID=UPI003A97E5A8
MLAVYPDNENSRLDALHALSIIGTKRQAEFDDVVAAVADIFECPIALVSLVDTDHQWFKACTGLDLETTPRNISFCQHTILSREPLVVPDTHCDKRFKTNPFVTGAPHIRFYAGVPLSLDGEHNLGTLCVIGDEPKWPSQQQLNQLQRMSRVVEALLKAHETSGQLNQALEQARLDKAAAMRESDLLQEITNVSGVGGWELDPSTGSLSWTDKTREIHEVDPDFTPTVEQALDFYPGESGKIITAAVESATENGTGWDLELPFRTAKGRDIWVRAVGRPIFHDGEIARFVGSFQDITHRKQQSEMVQAIFDNFPGALAYHDHDMRLLACNDAFRDFFNFPEEMIQQQLPMLDYMIYLAERGDYGPGDPETLARARYEKAYAHKKPTVMERETQDGTVMESRITPLPNGRYVISFLDITSRKTAERSLMQSEAIQRTTLECVGEGVLVLSRCGKIVSINPVGEKLLGSSEDALLGTSAHDLRMTFTFEDAGLAGFANPFVVALAEPSRLNDTVMSVEYADSPEKVWLRMDAALVAGSGGIDDGLVVITLTDITEAKSQLDTLQAIVNNMPGGLVYYDQRKRLAVCNDEFQKLLALPQEFIEEKAELSDIARYLAHRGDYGPGDPEQVLNDKLVAIQRVDPYLYERKSPDGKDLEIRGVMLPDGSIVSSFFDVSERKRLEGLSAQREQEIRRHADQVAAILANMNQGVSVFDGDARLVLWNQRYIDIFGKPEGEIYAGASLAELLQAEKDRNEFDGDIEQHVADLQDRLRSGDVVRHKFPHPNGKVIRAVHAPMPDGGWIGTHEDVTEQEQAAAKIEFAAHHDPLTGLANRTLFNTTLDETLSAAAAEGKHGHLLTIDLDHFKPVNDTFGHDTGDDLLRQVAGRLKECVRNSDLIARLGGDEFAIILAGSGSSDAIVAVIADRIVKKLNSPFRCLGHDLSVGGSIGIAAIVPGDVDPKAIVKQADTALYRAKKLGRNGFQFFQQEEEPTQVARRA